MADAFFFFFFARIQKVHEPEAHSCEERNIPHKDLYWRENPAGCEGGGLGSSPHSAINSSDLESVLHSPGLKVLIYEETALQWDRGGGSSSTFFLLCSKIQPQSFTKDFEIVQFGHFSSKINIVLRNEKPDYNIKIILIMLKHSHTQISVLNPIYKINTLNGSIYE